MTLCLMCPIVFSKAFCSRYSIKIHYLKNTDLFKFGEKNVISIRIHVR